MKHRWGAWLALGVSVAGFASCGGKAPEATAPSDATVAQAPADVAPPKAKLTYEEAAKAPPPVPGRSRPLAEAKAEAAAKVAPPPALPEGNLAKLPFVEPGHPVSDLEMRGAYVAKVAGCVHCHTEMHPGGVLGQPFAGGFKGDGRIGPWRSPNITQDKKTGIGAWTDDEILAALREGKRPDGGMLSPIMPYVFFNAMTDADARALVAYLRTIPAVENAVEGNTGLKAPIVHVDASPRAEPKTQLERGRYLATLMHCGVCHMAVGLPGAWFSSGPALKLSDILPPRVWVGPPGGGERWSDEDLIGAIRDGLHEGSPMNGPMSLYSRTWKDLTPEDMNALLAFLKSEPQ
ncbi:MAG: c-type cytochrome [Deltaproteobacteria bacterium]|nr:c-type cytochrome [Deltaproteobacteria bacterium]